MYSEDNSMCRIFFRLNHRLNQRHIFRTRRNRLDYSFSVCVNTSTFPILTVLRIFVVRFFLVQRCTSRRGKYCFFSSRVEAKSSLS
ncbi:hypothetical protein VNO80_21415 [Phaseolus coccineus]|uniref:Uncharacterized protein n=1 Tax=Phaseolus coccineus TaxID=3886 RepID=A0AAN9M321_PHACN